MTSLNSTDLLNEWLGESDEFDPMWDAIALEQALLDGDYAALPAVRNDPKRQMPAIGYGEIKPDSLSGRASGVRQLRGRIARGNPALVTYDARGNIYLRIWDNQHLSGNPTWSRHIGSVTVPQGATPAAIGTAIENRIRQLVQRYTGYRFQPKHGNAIGIDLRRIRGRPRVPAAQRSRLGIGVSRLDDFFADW